MICSMSEVAGVRWLLQQGWRALLCRRLSATLWYKVWYLWWLCGGWGDHSTRWDIPWPLLSLHTLPVSWLTHIVQGAHHCFNTVVPISTIRQQGYLLAKGTAV